MYRFQGHGWSAFLQLTTVPFFLILHIKILRHCGRLCPCLPEMFMERCRSTLLLQVPHRREGSRWVPIISCRALRGRGPCAPSFGHAQQPRTCSEFPRPTVLVAVSPYSSGLIRQRDLQCSLSDCCVSDQKALGKFFLYPRSPIHTAAGSCYLHGLWIMC